MSPTVGPVQHHRFVICNSCNEEATISILRVGNQAIDSNDRAKACMEIQLVGRFQVVTMELFGSVGMRLPCSNFCCQGPPNCNPNRRYQGNLIKTSFVPEQGYSIKFGRLKVDGQSLEVNGIDGYWMEAPWRACGFFEGFGLGDRTQFCVIVPQWPPTLQQIDDYVREKTLTVCRNAWRAEFQFL
uniref:uncharacterized protein LOC105351764 n=1 Tax=Fragaria vesca subsp. vesca TaxID=101020 RepID=UPI0005C85251|nr:PREDICTED: uncharacterized protein LOC105351764 [Fragaria vesca subsp. vesca]